MSSFEKVSPGMRPRFLSQKMAQKEPEKKMPWVSWRRGWLFVWGGGREEAGKKVSFFLQKESISGFPLVLSFSLLKSSR